MKRIALHLVIGIVVVGLLGCNTLGRQPKITAAAVTPNVLKPEDTAVITVEVVDRYDIVANVVGVIRDDPRIDFRLQDNGVPPDAKAGDGIWSMQVDVPFDAPPGEFILDFTAYDAAGNEIVVRTKDQGDAPLTATCSLVVEYPQEGQ